MPRRPPSVRVWLPSLAGQVPVPAPLAEAALLLRHRGVKGVHLDRALRFIGRARTAHGSSFLVVDAVADQIDAVLPPTWEWAADGWELMRREESPTTPTTPTTPSMRSA